MQFIRLTKPTQIGQGDPMLVETWSIKAVTPSGRGARLWLDGDFETPLYFDVAESVDEIAAILEGALGDG